MSDQPPVHSVKLALLGFGNVGQAFAQLLLNKRRDLAENPGVQFQVVGIATGSHGTAINPDGLSLQKTLQAVREGTSLDEFSLQPVQDSQEFIQTCGADVLLETTPVNYQNGQPALEYLTLGLNQGMHAVTANKGPVVHGYRQLKEIGRAHV